MYSYVISTDFFLSYLSMRDQCSRLRKICWRSTGPLTLKIQRSESQLTSPQIIFWIWYSYSHSSPTYRSLSSFMSHSSSIIRGGIKLRHNIVTFVLLKLYFTKGQSYRTTIIKWIMKLYLKKKTRMFFISGNM